MIFEATIALVCITAPEPIDQPPCSLATIQAVAVSLELMDPRERRLLLVRREDFKDDMNLIHQRYKELKDAPLQCDAERFPAREQINQWLAFNREYTTWLEHRKSLFKDAWIDEAIADCEHAHRVYDLCYHAGCGFYYTTLRREALLNLRKEIGDVAYYTGTLPAVVPVWHFRRIDD